MGKVKRFFRFLAVNFFVFGFSDSFGFIGFGG